MKPETRFVQDLDDDIVAEFRLASRGLAMKYDPLRADSGQAGDAARGRIELNGLQPLDVDHRARLSSICAAASMSQSYVRIRVPTRESLSSARCLSGSWFIFLRPTTIVQGKSKAMSLKHPAAARRSVRTHSRQFAVD